MSNFPKYMISKNNGAVVCFASPKVGMQVYPENGIQFDTRWNMEYFTDCEDQLNPIPLTIERQAEKVMATAVDCDNLTDFIKDVEILCNLILKK